MSEPIDQSSRAAASPVCGRAASATIVVTVNGSVVELVEPTTVAVLAARFVASPRGVAVAVNEWVIPRSEWGDVELHAGDRVEVLRAAQGGCA